jgi:RNA recognition motif-containing protein
VFRRFNSDDARPIKSADGQEDSTVRSAIESSETTHASNERPYAPRNSFRNLPDRFIRNPNPTVYIGNLLFEVSPADLEKEFEQFGTIKSTKVITDDRGMSKG